MSRTKLVQQITYVKHKHTILTCGPGNRQFKALLLTTTASSVKVSRITTRFNVHLHAGETLTVLPTVSDHCHHECAQKTYVGFCLQEACRATLLQELWVCLTGGARTLLTPRGVCCSTGHNGSLVLCEALVDNPCESLAQPVGHSISSIALLAVQEHIFS